jgi:predicted nucleic acid-binding protein
MIVVDCTVISDFFIGIPEHADAAAQLLEADPAWISPVLWRYEFGNVLLKGVRSGRISSELMNRYLEAAEGLVIESVVELDSPAVGELAQSREISFYDASYAWLGQARGLPFHSRDTKLRRKCPDLVLPMPGCY